MREHGAPGQFEIVAGERRWRAAQRAGLHEVPIAIVDATDVQSLEFAIIENVQRADLNAIEEAAGYVALMEQCNHTQEQVAQIVGKSRPHVANTVRLMKLPEPVKALVRQGKLSAGHARLLVGHANAQFLADMTIGEGFSVRQLEEWVRVEEGQAGRYDLRRHAEENPRRRRGRQGPRHARAGAAAVGRARAGRDHRAARCRRHPAHQVQGFGSVGCGVEEIG